MVSFDEDHHVGRFEFQWRNDRDVQRTIFHVRNPTADATPEDWERCALVMSLTLTQPPDGLFSSPELVQFMGRETSLLETTVRFALGATILRVLKLPLFFLALDHPERGPCLPGNATFAVQWRTGMGGRRGIGRTFVPCLASTVTEAGNRNVVAQGQADGIVTALARLIPQVVFAGGHATMFQLAVYHRDGIAGLTGPDRWSTPIVGARYVDRSIDSQRGRVPGHVYH